MDSWTAPSPAAGSRFSWWAAAALFVVVTSGAHLVGGAMVGRSMVAELRTQAGGFDERFDPIVVQGGVVTAGPRLVDVDDGKMRLLVDPDETVPDEAIAATDAVVVRRTEIVRKERFREQRYPIGELQTALGTDPLVIDGAHLEGWTRDYATHVIVGNALFFGLLIPLDLALLGGSAAVAARLGASLAGDSTAWRGPLAIGLLVGAAIVVLKWLAFAAGLPSSAGCFGLFLWPVVVGAPTVAAAMLGRRRAA